jgi:trafficking protein particle complex subunit 10
MDVIHTVSLELHRETLVGPAEVQAVAIGQAIPAELAIQHTRKWSDPSSTLDGELEFCFEVHASPDTWVIGGQRKAHFSSRVGRPPLTYVILLTPCQEHETLSFPLLLLPQRTGHLLYPSVDVTISDRQKTEPQGNPGRPPHTSEMDYRNQGDTLLVVPNLSSTTVSIDLENMASGALVVESTSKNDI